MPCAIATWELTDDKETFFDYVESEVEMFLDEWSSGRRTSSRHGRGRRTRCRRTVAGDRHVHQPLSAGHEHRRDLLHRQGSREPGRVFASGLLYTVGRSLAYVGLGVLLLVESLVAGARRFHSS